MRRAGPSKLLLRALFALGFEQDARCAWMWARRGLRFTFDRHGAQVELHGDTLDGALGIERMSGRVEVYGRLRRGDRVVISRSRASKK